MKKFLLTAFLGILFVNVSQAEKRYEFSVVCNDGTTLYFNRIEETVWSSWYFDDITNLVEVTCPGTYEHSYNGYIEPIGKVVIPSIVEYEGITYTVAAVGGCAFDGCKKLESVVIPNTVKVIATFAFRNCTSLKSVTIPNSVVALESSSFSGCSSLTQLTIPASVTSIKDHAFQKTGLKSITFPSSILKYGDGICEYCEELKTVVLPSNLKEIGTAWFAECPKLTTVKIPSGVKEIDMSAFRNCVSLNITVPNTVTYVSNNGSFENCLNVKYYGKLPDAPWGAIGYNAYVEGDLVYKDNTKKVLLGCRKSPEITKVTIPDSVVEIKSKAFYGMSHLHSIIVGKSVRIIGDEAFCLWAGSNWENITILFKNPKPPVFGKRVFAGNKNEAQNCATKASIMAPDSIMDALLDAILDY